MAHALLLPLPVWRSQDRTRLASGRHSTPQGYGAAGISGRYVPGAQPGISGNDVLAQIRPIDGPGQFAPRSFGPQGRSGRRAPADRTAEHQPEPGQRCVAGRGRIRKQGGKCPIPPARFRTAVPRVPGSVERGSRAVYCRFHVWLHPARQPAIR